MSASYPRIGYTLGDQAGIGPEIIEAALAAYADAPCHFQLMGERIECQLGQPTPQTAQAAWDHLELAAEALKKGAIKAVITAPICKEALQQLGFPYPGQTEFFADRMGCSDFAMCLTGKHLSVALATTHVALADVPRILNKEGLVRVSLLLARFLQKHCKQGRQKPLIAIAGLNPHNGEGGAFGDEESRIISPAVEQLQSQYAHVADFVGPCVPDVVYRDAMQGAYDGIVAPYHDQALIPLKLIDFDNAVNATIGMERLRVSPDHGTAFAIAGKGIAKADSMKRAFALAIASIS